MTDFIARYTKTAGGVPASHVFNYDETGIKDNPGSQKGIFQKGVKYAEEIRDSTKSSISVMFCGSAAGVFLPPYVIYKVCSSKNVGTYAFLISSTLLLHKNRKKAKFFYSLKLSS